MINGDANTAAMFINAAHKAPPTGRGWTLLPGNKSVLLPFGLAISADTQHPDLAYALINSPRAYQHMTQASVNFLGSINAVVVPTSVVLTLCLSIRKPR